MKKDPDPLNNSPLVLICFILLFLITACKATRVDTPVILPVSPALTNCLMIAPKAELKMPRQGFTRLDEANTDICPPISENWDRVTLIEDVEILFYTDGPGGSGRYWDISIGWTNQKGAPPQKGFCLTTTTIAWRTFSIPVSAQTNDLYASLLPLRWLKDLDGDTRPEFIYWDSFRLDDDPEAPPVMCGLIGWVYQIQADGTCTLDLQTTRQLAEEIASAYHIPVEDKIMLSYRKKAADALEAFASETCNLKAR